MARPAEEVERYILDNWQFYGKNGLGWKTPNQCIQFYLANDDAFGRDLTGIDALIAEARYKAFSESMPNRETISASLKADLDQIRRMAADGYDAAEISNATGLALAGVKNVLKLRGIDDVSEISEIGPANDVIGKFRREFGKGWPGDPGRHRDKGKDKIADDARQSRAAEIATPKIRNGRVNARPRGRYRRKGGG